MTSGFAVSRKLWWVVRIGSFCPKCSDFTDKNGLKVGHIIIDFEYFEIQNWMLQTVRADKADVVICLVSMFPSWVMVNKLSKKGHFKQFWADVSMKSKSLKGTYIYESESSHYTLSENAMVYRCLGKCLWDISD